jgi:hypothetical protein
MLVGPHGIPKEAEGKTYLFEFSTFSHRGCYFSGPNSFSNANKPIIFQITFQHIA